MVFDPTKTREKSTVLHQLTDGNRFVSNANLLQLVMFMSFENEYVKCFGTKYRANKFVRASTACVTTSPTTSDGMRFAWIINWNWEWIFFDANGNTGGNLLVSLRNLHAVSSSGELYTLSRCENKFECDRSSVSLMDERTNGLNDLSNWKAERSLTNPNRRVESAQRLNLLRRLTCDGGKEVDPTCGSFTNLLTRVGVWLPISNAAEM